MWREYFLFPDLHFAQHFLLSSFRKWLIHPPFYEEQVSLSLILCGIERETEIRSVSVSMW